MTIEVELVRCGSEPEFRPASGDGCGSADFRVYWDDEHGRWLMVCQRCGESTEIEPVIE